MARRRRRRRLPRMAGHSIYRGHYRHNPAKKGMNWMPIVLIGGAAIFLLPRLMGGTGILGGGTSVLPAGYTYLGSGYYRGPDGQTYYRSPTTGQMSPASTTQVAGAQVQQAGLNVLTGVLPAVTTAATSLFSGLIQNVGGWFSNEQEPITEWGVVGGPIEATGGVMPTQESMFGGSEVGYVPPPLPEFPELAYEWPADEYYYEGYYDAYATEPVSYEMSLELAPAAVGINDYYDYGGYF